jgi:ketosteroid isomerase-like protein
MPDESTTPGLVEITRRSFETGNRRDFDLLSSFFAPDAVFDMSQVGLARLEGVEAIREFLEDWWGAYEEFEAEAEEVVDLGNGVTFATIFQAGRPVGSSGDLALRYWAVNLFVGGVIVQTTNYPATRFRPIGRHEFEARVSPVDPAEVATFPVRVDRAHEV